MPKSHREPDAAPRAPDGGRARELLARKWSSLLKRVVVVDFPGDELDRELREQLDGVCAALLAEPFTTAPLELLGERLVGLGHVGEEALATTADVLGRGLLALPELQPVERFAERVVVGLGALSAGFAAAARRVVLDQQETMRLSLLKAVRDAKGTCGRARPASSRSPHPAPAASWWSTWTGGWCGPTPPSARSWAARRPS